MDTPQKQQKTVKLNIQSPNQQQVIVHKSSIDSMLSASSPRNEKDDYKETLGHSQLELSHIDLEFSQYETSALKADSPVRDDKEAKYLHKGNPTKLTRSCLKFFTDGFLSLLLCMLMYTVFIHLSDAFWLYSNRVELAKRFEVKPVDKAQELTPEADFAVILITQGRNDYMKSMPQWMSSPTPNSKGQFMIIDFESDVPIKSNIPGMHVVRKDPLAPNVHTKFSKWEGLAIALNYIKAKKVFYFDACTYPKQYFRFEKYLLQENINFFFVNDDRPMSGSFLADREDIVKFLSEIPLHIATDYRSFFGEDWMIDWYFNGRKADDWLGHYTHPSTQNFSEFAPDSIVAVRMMIYMNRYAQLVDVSKNGQIEGRCHGGLSIFSCSVWGKVLALPGLWHIIDAVLSMDFLFKLIAFIFNRLFDWYQTIVVLVLVILVSWSTLTYFASKLLRYMFKNFILARYSKSTSTKGVAF